MPEQTVESVHAIGICSRCGLDFSSCTCPVEMIDAKEVGGRIEFYVKRATANADRLRKLGEWPCSDDDNHDHEDAVESLAGRLPQHEGDVSAGFDAGVACALDLIPRDKQKLAARLHVNYSPEAIAVVLKDTENIENLDLDSESCWWLAACSLCTEGNMDQAGFIKQLKAFDKLRIDPAARKEAAQNEYKKMTNLFHMETFTHPDTGKTIDVPFGEEDGCIQGAYLKGHKFAASHLKRPNSEWYEVGSFFPSLGIEDYAWTGTYLRDGKQKQSGPQYGAKNFIRCGNKDELVRALFQINIETK